MDGRKLRNSHQRCSVKKGLLKNFANFTGKHLCWSLFLIELLDFIKTLSKRDSNTGVFLWNVKFLKTLILKNIFERLLFLTYQFSRVIPGISWALFTRIMKGYFFKLCSQYIAIVFPRSISTCFHTECSYLNFLKRNLLYTYNFYS